jgi:uncharacterized protein
VSANRQAMWQRLDSGGPGLEHLQLGRGWVSSSVIGRADGLPFSLRYRIETDTQGHPSACELRVSGRASLALTRSAAGVWSGNAQEWRDLAGCTDLDLNITPYTATLALRRLRLRPGQSGEVLAARIQVPELTRQVAVQRYTCLSLTTYQFENLSDGESSTFGVDEDLFVRHWPGRFELIEGHWNRIEYME